MNRARGEQKIPIEIVGRGAGGGGIAAVVSRAGGERRGAGLQKIHAQARIRRRGRRRHDDAASAIRARDAATESGRGQRAAEAATKSDLRERAQNIAFGAGDMRVQPRRGFERLARGRRKAQHALAESRQIKARA